MVSDSNELVVIPHPFAHKEKRAILAFVEGKILQDEAVMAGADIAVGRDMIKKILKGQFMIDDYDFCVAHTNMIGEIPTLRGILRHRFPTKINGILMFRFLPTSISCNSLCILLLGPYLEIAFVITSFSICVEYFLRLIWS